MNKKLIRLTESDLHKIIKESVNKILKEVYNKEELIYVDAEGHKYKGYTFDELTLMGIYPVARIQ